MARKSPPKPNQPARPLCPFTLVIDSREQSPYLFNSIPAYVREGSGILEVPTMRAGLKHGDYIVFSMPSFCIERKSLADLYGSISKRDNWIGRLEAMSDECELAKIVVEAELSTIISHPPPFTKIKPKTVASTIRSWSRRFPKVQWWFLPNREWAEVWTFRELEGWWRDHNKQGDEVIDSTNDEPV